MRSQIDSFEFLDPYICATEKSAEIYNAVKLNTSFGEEYTKKLRKFCSTLCEYNPKDRFLQCLRLRIDSIEQEKSLFRESLVDALELDPLNLESYRIGIEYYAKNKCHAEEKNLIQILNLLLQSMKSINGTVFNKQRILDMLKDFYTEDPIILNGLLAVEFMACLQNNVSSEQVIDICCDIISANCARPWIYSVMLKCSFSAGKKSLQTTVVNCLAQRLDKCFSKRESFCNRHAFALLLNLNKNYSDALHISSLLARDYPKSEEAQLQYMIDLNACGRLALAQKQLKNALIAIPNSRQLMLAKNTHHIDFFNINQASRSLAIYHNQRSSKRFDSYEYCLNQLIKAKSFARKIEDNYDCDIICIASDEAPYIHEFIFHYIYLGFKNIFIGVNNTSDLTIKIIQKIQESFSQVHLYNVQESIDNGRQDACYTQLYGQYLKSSSSQYFLIVDIDEFWVTSKFPEKISEYIQRRNPFLLHSLNIVNLHNEKFFAKCFQPELTFFPSAFVKTITSRCANLTNIRAHASYISVRTNKSLLTTPIGINSDIFYDEYGKGIKVPSRVDHANAVDAVCFHRLFRSEIEYAYRIFKPRPNAEKETEIFKTNRSGHDIVTRCSDPKLSRNKHLYIIKMKQYYGSWFVKNDLEQYWDGLNAFVEKCSIQCLLADSRSLINEEYVLLKLAEIQEKLDKNQVEKLNKALTNTKFQKFINR